MDVTLQRNGYNLQRRKMYIQNPRHNLKSSVEFAWKESLDGNFSDLEKRKQYSSQLTKDSYNKAIDKKIENQLKINKSSFRVMPAPESYRTIENKRSDFYDSLNKEVQERSEKKPWFQSSISQRQSPLKKKQELSKSVFGYEIDRTSFRKESYLSRILGERLQPYLKKDQEIPRHQSFTINSPVALNY